MRGVVLLAAAASAWVVQIPMRDNYTLGTAISCDPSKRNLTVVIDRSTYSRFFTELFAVAMADALGPEFCAVRQDMRGTGFSSHLLPGKVKHQDFTFWRSDGNDTADTNAWLVAQPWSNGRVLQMGVSSDGLGTLSGNMGRPVGLDAQFVVWASISPRDVMYIGGAYREGLFSEWAEKIFILQHKQLIQQAREHEAPGTWWDPLNVSAHCDLINTPSVFWGGWYDIMLRGTIGAFECAQYHGGPKARGQSRIIIDPCGHCQNASKYWGPDLFKGRAALPVLAGLDLFSGKHHVAEFTKRVTFYVLGAIGESDAPGNHRTTLDDFPQFTPTPMYMSGGGALTMSPQGAEDSISYLYDPTNPVPTKGGSNLLFACGPLDQSEVETRLDVQVFTSPVLTDPVALTGPVSAKLWVSSNATDTDFTVKLTDVYGNGTSRIVQDGIIRMRWRLGDYATALPQLLTPGKLYQVEVSLWNTSFVFAAGHRIRVAVSSSNAPRFEPNPNTGRLLADPQLPPVVANNTLHIGGATPSQIVLPVVPLSALPEHRVLDTVDQWLAARPASWRKVVEWFENQTST